MRQIAVTSVILIVLGTVLSEANVQIKPIAVDNKSGNKDLKPEEARYRDPIIPEYYQGNRQGFVTSNIMDSYGAYDRYGYNNFDNKLGTTFYDRFGTNKYGLDYNNRDRFGSNYGLSATTPLESKFGILESKLGSFGKPYPPPPPYPTEGGAIFGPYGYPTGGLLPPELEKKASVVLPLAGAALLGIATYALVTGSGVAAAGPVIGKRRKRSLFDEKVEQHLAYRAHKKQQKTQ